MMLSAHEFSKAAQLLYSGLRKKLVHLHLQILYQCNFKCGICDFWQKPFSDLPQMSPEQVALIARKLKPLGPQLICVGGGEPLLHEDLCEIVAILANNNFPIMVSNGWLMNKEKARALFQAGLQAVSISVDYASAARHDGQRGRPGAFDRALAALAALRENRTRPEQRVHMISVLMEDNIDEIEPLVKLAKELGVSYFLTFYCNSRGRREQHIAPKEMARRLLDIQKRYPEFVSLPGYIARFAEADEAGHGIGPCFAGRNLYNINCQGQVTRCIDRLSDPVGNILSDPLGQIVQGLRQQYLARDCRDCWTSCRGSIETLLYGPGILANLAAYHRMLKAVPLTKGA